ncbi:TPA: type 1 fimbrial major subunit FimA [Klebsiella quasipneumoniae subsp. similipneumoniae]
MKIKTLAFAVAALSFASVAANAATVVVNGGQVHFKGEVVNAACAIDAGSMDQTVQMGQVRTAQLNAAGKTSTPVGFEIKLVDCDTTVATKSSVAFVGSAVNAANPTVLALQSSSAGGATNVGVQIVDKNGTALSVDGNTFSSPITLIDGTNLFKFQARYFSTAAATAGTANADASFKVQYQ